MTQYNMNTIERTVTPPADIFRDSSFGWGLLTIDPIDSDFGVRHLNTGIENLRTATWIAAQALDREFEKRSGRRRQDRWLNYLGPPGVIPSVSISQALLEEGVPPGYFKDKIVLVGGKYATGFTGEIRDNFRTPYSLRGHSYITGVELHAIYLANLINGNWLLLVSSLGELSLVLLFGGVAGIVFGIVNPRLSFLIAIIGAAAIAFLSILMTWETNRFFSWLIPVGVQIPVACILSVGSRFYIERRKRQRLVGAFAGYLSPVMVNRIIESDVGPKLGGEMRDVTAMFTDLQDFTSLSDSANPQEIGDILNTYFEIATKDILEKDGTIIKYIGDAVMAIWGAPLDDLEQADHAVEASWGMIQSTRNKKIYGHSLHTRIGINSGPCLVGNLGSPYRFDYTAIGDTINLASRIEGFNKQLGTNVLLSHSTYERLNGNHIIRPVGKFQLVGKQDAIPLYELLTHHTDEPTWLQTFAEALEAFNRRDFTSAADLFEKTNDMRRVQDGPSCYYLEKIKEFKIHPPQGRFWEGEISVTSK